MLLQHAVKTVVAPSALRPGLSPAIDEVILRALAKDPRARTASAEDFRRGLMAARRQMRQKPRAIAAVVEPECAAPTSGVVLSARARAIEDNPTLHVAPGSLALGGPRTFGCGNVLELSEPL
jgi:serine/threonine-protein kinase